MRISHLFNSALVLALAACSNPDIGPLLDQGGEVVEPPQPEDKLVAVSGVALEGEAYEREEAPVDVPPPPPRPATCEEDTPACDAACTRRTTRASLWVTQYDVGGTLGFGEHQGLGLMVHTYVTDPRFESDGVAPWRKDDGALWQLGDAVTASEQFSMRTLNPGGETQDAEPVSLVSALDDERFCDLEVQLDRRLYNHGRTLTEEVPTDGYYTNRGLIPVQLIAAVISDEEDALTTCMAVIEDGYCDAVCGNCSYSADLLNGNEDFDLTQPGGQLPDEVRPFGSSPAPEPCAEDPNTITPELDYVCGRTPFSRTESGREVHYVGGSIWGPGDDAEQDGVAWTSMAEGNWPDPFTHCYDPNSASPQQSPLGVIGSRTITGKWGHNSNSDAEAALRHFLGCAEDPSRAGAWFNSPDDGSPCTACGEVRGGEQPRQEPCVDLTQTASIGWGYEGWVDVNGVGTSTSTVGIHNIGDLDVGKYDETDRTSPRFGLARTWSDLPKPVCRDVGLPVFGM